MTYLRSDARRIKQARAYMESGQYQRARQLISGINSSDAIELAAMLNEREIRRTRNENPQKNPIPDSKPVQSVRTDLSSLDRMAIVVILICMLVWTIVLIVFSYILGGSGALLISIGSSVLYWVVLWVTYYVLWRWFWIVTAIGWLIGSLYACGTLLVFGDLNQLMFSLASW
jgi:hypothetical protein